MKRVAVIPARGGSKRIPRKNIVDFAGRPLIAWTIEAALESKLFDAVVVSTDDEEIADVSRNYGATVPFLRTKHADDHSPVSLATVSTLQQLERDGAHHDVVVQLFAACPLRTAPDIQSAVDHFERHDLSFQISCFDMGWAHPWWAVRLAHDGTPSPLFPEQRLHRSQDLDRLYCPTGAIWVARVEALKTSQTFYGPDHRYHEIHWSHAVDIDEPDDLLFALALKQLTSPPHH